MIVRFSPLLSLSIFFLFPLPAVLLLTLPTKLVCAFVSLCLIVQQISCVPFMDEQLKGCRPYLQIFKDAKLIYSSTWKQKFIPYVLCFPFCLSLFPHRRLIAVVSDNITLPIMKHAQGV